MNAKDNGLVGPDEKRPAPWRSSLYHEPLWVSVAWVLGPLLVATVGIYFSVR